MLTEADEMNYHEMFAHVPLNVRSDASRVLIVGGGDGGVCKQVLQHENIRDVVWVEIDKMVVDIAREHFPGIAGSCERSPRVKLVVEDASLWAERASKTSEFGCFDVVLVDSTDFGVSDPLRTSEFYEDLKSLLCDRKGVIVSNFEDVGWRMSDKFREQLVSNSKKRVEAFEHNSIYTVSQPSYASGTYSYIISSDGINFMEDMGGIDWDAYERKGIQATLEYYTPSVHVASFQLPVHVAKSYAQLELGSTSSFLPKLISKHSDSGSPSASASANGTHRNLLSENDRSGLELLPVQFQVSPEPRLGTHYIFELWRTADRILNNAEKLRGLLEAASALAELTVVDTACHAFPQQGVTCVVLLRESHMSIHTWPEYGYAAVDLFTCKMNSSASANAALELIKKSIGAQESNLHTVARGFFANGN